MAHDPYDPRTPKLKPGQYYGVDNDIFHGDPDVIDKEMRAMLTEAKARVKAETELQDE